MALASAVQGARHTAQEITWAAAGGQPQDLTGATLTGRIFDPRTGQARAIDGTLSVSNPSGGEFTWTYGEQDVVHAGAFQVQFVATYAGGQCDKTILESWLVERAA